MNARIRIAVGGATGAAVTGSRTLTGGDINHAYAATLEDGREVFVKASRTGQASPEMFRAEARGLAWLEAAGALRVPTVIATGDDFLVLELIRPTRPGRSFDEELGRGLAALHRASPATFGLDHDNFIGTLPQSNRLAGRWSDFYASARLEPQLKRAIDGGRMSPTVERGMRRVMSDLDRLVGPPEPPARLHGDLWSGNLMCDDRGAPCLIDPAVYGGHREMDLAMMRLFGGFSTRTLDAYKEAFPLAPGHRERVALYQLYPLLVHLNLFGGSYLGAVEAALATIA